MTDPTAAGNQLRRGGLGRGLASLIPSTGDGAGGDPTTAHIDTIQPNPYQPRSEWNDDRLAELAESIRTHGLIQPLIVSLGRKHGTYVLIAGERRLRAARMAGMTDVPVVIKDVSPQSLLELALVENLVRADLNPLEEAHAYWQLTKDFGLTHEGVAERVGRSRVSITNKLRLLELPNSVQQALTNGEITEGHARSLLGLPTAIDQASALKQIIEKSLSVRQTEELVRNWVSKSETTVRRVHEDDRYSWRVADRLQRALGTKVSVKRDQTTGQGSIAIHFFDDEQLTALLAKLAGEDDF